MLSACFADKLEHTEMDSSDFDRRFQWFIKRRGVATCTHGRTCVTEKMSKKGNSGFICSSTCAEQKENIQRIILEFTGKNDRTLSLCL